MDAAFLADFRETVDDAAARLLTLSSEQAADRPAPDKWSPKEIIGHLIDSASNNHGRFVRAQLQDDHDLRGIRAGGMGTAFSATRSVSGPIWCGSGRHSTITSPHVMETADAGRADPASRPRTTSTPSPGSLRRWATGYPRVTSCATTSGHLKHHLRQALLASAARDQATVISRASQTAVSPTDRITRVRAGRTIRD